MGGYDVAIKVLLERCRDAALEFFLDIPVEETEVAELPQETASLRRTDFPVRVTTKDGRERIVILEVQSRWRADVPLRLLEYEARYRLRYAGAVEGVVILLTPSRRATDRYRAGGIRYRFRLVRVAELDAREVLRAGTPCLMPFVALMRGGLELYREAESVVYQSPLDTRAKGDLLTGMAVLSGLVSSEIPRWLVANRRDLMMESAAYEIIKREGVEEGIQQGFEQGVRQGVQQGMRQGMLETAREMLLEALSERFGPVPLELETLVEKVQSRAQLKELHRFVFRAQSLEDVRRRLAAAVLGDAPNI